MKKKTQLAVIGGGHAGIEAALAAARMGIDTVLFTISMDGVANMPCNPSIGGTAKGHLVFEIDALGGEMGRAADLVTLQSRTLNTGKGAAVQSKRIQADRRLYQRIMKHTLETTPHLHPMQAEIVGITTEEFGSGRRVTGVTTAIGEEWECEAVIVATGTYLDSRIFVGEHNYPAGPDGFLPAAALTRSLARAGVSVRRFKTGTPPRILRSSVDFSCLEEQPGEEHITPFSVLTDEDEIQKIQDLEQAQLNKMYQLGYEDGLAERSWIPCNEKLPKQGQKVICQCRANIITVLKLNANGDWYQDKDHCYMSGFVIAWMPLPEPWKGEQE